MTNQEKLLDLESVFTQTMKKLSHEWQRTSEIKYARSHIMILLQLKDKGSQKASELAQALSVTSGGITGLTDKLVQEGLITRNRDSKDRRVVYFHLSEKGEQIHGQLIDFKTRFLRNLFDGFSEEELSQMAGFYKRMLYNLDN